VAAVGIASVAAIEVVNLLTAQFDSAVTSIIIGAITLFVGYAFGKKAE